MLQKKRTGSTPAVAYILFTEKFHGLKSESFTIALKQAYTIQLE